MIRLHINLINELYDLWHQKGLSKASHLLIDRLESVGVLITYNESCNVIYSLTEHLISERAHIGEYYCFDLKDEDNLRSGE